MQQRKCLESIAMICLLLAFLAGCAEEQATLSIKSPGRDCIYGSECKSGICTAGKCERTNCTEGETINSRTAYCQNGVWRSTKENGERCSNDYECADECNNNTCIERKCINGRCT